MRQKKLVRKKSYYIWVDLAGHKLYCANSCLTITPPELYMEEMEEVASDKCHLRAYVS